jgi:hypothetical protein
VGIDKELIKKARSVNLAQCLISDGIQLKRVGLRYIYPEHDSLVFTGNTYYWNSRQEHGNSVDYLVKNMGMSFQEAINVLCEFEGVAVEIEEKENFSLENIKFTTDMKKTIAYLNTARGLNIDIIKFFINLGVVKQTAEKNNIAFLMLDKHCEIVGIEYNTTLSDKKFKGIEKGSEYGYGFNIRNTNEPEKAFFFESAIDLISFVQYIGFEKAYDLMDNSIFLSMAGLKENVFEHTQELYNKPKNVFLCVDNDQAGLNFVNNIKSKYESFDIKYIFPKKCKDWNELYRRA